ncbi:MAG TPA: LLM class F420-dependent oxidoreductase [Candidatus Binatia bacterium]|nr:LLM class F420-dependent oxidoreductase [Candidatus Binatia bacterium]
MTHPVRFGIQTGQQGIAWSEMLDLWQRADAWGYDTLWNFDHFLPIFTDPKGPCLEGWVTLSALGQATKRARIGHLVNGNTYRNPCILAKMAATLDHVTGGRLNLGIGAGWFEQEHRAFGIDFKTIPGRLRALDEACEILKGMFRGEPFSFEGKHYKVQEAIGNPRPVQSPHPPIMIGGVGEKVLLRIVAKHADMWNASGPAEKMQHLIDVIRRHGDAVGRDTSAIEKTVMMPLCYTTSRDRQQFVCQLVGAMQQCSPEEARARVMIGDKAECLDTIARYGKAGVTHFLFMLFQPVQPDEVQAFAEEVIPAARR